MKKRSSSRSSSSMSNASRSSSAAASRSVRVSRWSEHGARMPHRKRAEHQRDRLPRGIGGADPDIEEYLQGAGITTGRQRTQTGRRRAQQVPPVAAGGGKPQRIGHERDVPAVGAEQRGRRRHHRLQFCILPLQRPDGIQRARIADPGKRQNRVVLQRPGLAGNPHQQVERVRRPVVSERLDHGAPEEVHPPVDVDDEALAHRGVGVVGRQGANQGRPDELGGLRLERRQERARHRRVRVVLEVAEGNRTQPVVRIRHHPEYRLLGHRPPEPYQEHQRPEPDVPIFVPIDGRGQRRPGLLFGHSSNQAARPGPHVRSRSRRAGRWRWPDRRRRSAPVGWPWPCRP